MKSTALKTLMLTLLLVIALTPPIYPQQNSGLQTTPSIELKTSLEKETYTKSEVEAIISVYKTELIRSIDNAYNEGYKQGLLEASPQAVYYKNFSDSLADDIKAMNRKLIIRDIAYPIAIAGGFIVGLTIPLLINRMGR